jgi:hypothetical protein
MDDLNDARESPFVDKILSPVEADSREEAVILFVRGYNIN